MKIYCIHKGLWGDKIQVANGVFVQLDAAGNAESADPAVLEAVRKLQGWGIRSEEKSALVPSAGKGSKTPAKLIPLTGPVMGSGAPAALPPALLPPDLRGRPEDLAKASMGPSVPLLAQQAGLGEGLGDADAPDDLPLSTP